MIQSLLQLTLNRGIVRGDDRGIGEFLQDVQGLRDADLPLSVLLNDVTGDGEEIRLGAPNILVIAHPQETHENLLSQIWDV